MKILINILWVLLILDCNAQDRQLTIKVKSEKDSVPIGLVQASIFEFSKQVKDTFCDFNGDLKIKMPNSTRVKSEIYFSSAGHFPQRISLSNISKDSVIFLRVDTLLTNSGGMTSSNELLELNSQIEQERKDWNKRNK